MPSSLDLCLGVSTLPKVSLSFESWPGMHILHSETFMSKLVASYFGETFTFLPMPSESEYDRSRIFDIRWKLKFPF